MDRTFLCCKSIFNFIAVSPCKDGSGGYDCCTADNPCAEGEGDCDNDSHCIGNLKCNNDFDNCNTDLGFPSDADCCYDPKIGIHYQKYFPCSLILGMILYWLGMKCKVN